MKYALTASNRLKMFRQQGATVLSFAELIGRLVKHAGKRIIIMPGSGLNASNIAGIAKVTGAKEFHLSARKVLNSGMIFRRDGISMGGFPDKPEYSLKVADPEIIINIINILKMI